MNGFLQQYGLNIVAVIIVLAFIVFASVFGDTITGGIKDITDDFFARSGVTEDVDGGAGGGIPDEEDQGGNDNPNNNSITFADNGTNQAEYTTEYAQAYEFQVVFGEDVNISDIRVTSSNNDIATAEFDYDDNVITVTVWPLKSGSVTITITDGTSTAICNMTINSK